MSAEHPGLTHFDASGAARMVALGSKPASARLARALGQIRMAPATLAVIRDGRVGKGDVLGVARIAAIMAAKRTADLIPLCHPLALTGVTVDFSCREAAGAAAANPAAPASIECAVSVSTQGPTGVEMEALLAVQIGLLTIYDMCKAIDRGMIISDVRLLAKHGGAGGPWLAAAGA